jgi:hypothetical protein
LSIASDRPDATDAYEVDEFIGDASPTQVTDRITEKLTGQKVIPNTSLSAEDKSPGWTKLAVGS